MLRLARYLFLACLLSTLLVSHSVAEEDLLAKVYRDYPGYIESPTCVNPQLADPATTDAVADSADASATMTIENKSCPESWTVTPMVGYHVIDGAMELDDNASFGLAIGYNLTCNWAIEADFRYTPTETDLNQGKNHDVDIWIIGGSALYHFQPEQKLVPYVAAGAGAIIYDVDGASSNDGDYMGYWGGGVKYALNQKMALRFDLRHIIDYRSDGDFNSQDGSDWRHHLSSMLGLTFNFGG